MSKVPESVFNQAVKRWGFEQNITQEQNGWGIPYAHSVRLAFPAHSGQTMFASWVIRWFLEKGSDVALVTPTEQHVDFVNDELLKQDILPPNPFLNLDQIRGKEWDAVVVDEAQAISNEMWDELYFLHDRGTVIIALHNTH